MAVSAIVSDVSPPDLRALVLPVLSALPGAAASTQPATAILPLLSPILRQRVQLLSSASTEPWIRLLTYDTSKVARLAQIAQAGSLEPHPVSGEIEVDFDYDVQTLYRRADEETLHALVLLETFELFVRLVYCTGDSEGRSDGWRVGEVGVSPVFDSEGSSSLVDAEQQFAARTRGSKKPMNGVGAFKTNGVSRTPAAEENDEDDDYWARYDRTPARTPAVKRSPAPPSMQATSQIGRTTEQRDFFQEVDGAAPGDDEYYARYDSVQPAMDNHDPDAEAEQQALGVPSPAPPLGLARLLNRQPSGSGSPKLTGGAWAFAVDVRQRSTSEHSARSVEDEERTAALMHPRPASSVSSNGSLTVARLEETAGHREQSEFGVKQHISRSIRSLFLLSRAAGIDRDEFEVMIKTELDVLAMMEDEI